MDQVDPGHRLIAAGNKLKELGFKPLTLQRIEAALAAPPADGGHPMEFELAVAAFAEESIGGFRLRVAALKQEAVVQNRAVKQTKVEAERTRIERAEAALERTLGDQPDPDPGNVSVLCGEVARVRVNGGNVLAAHLSVLGRMDFFAVYLARWADSGDEVLELELPEPCSSKDFLTLLRRLYGLNLELASLGAALRAAQLLPVCLPPGVRGLTAVGGLDRLALHVLPALQHAAGG